MLNYVPSYGPANAKLLICGEAPGKHEAAEGIPFVGATGHDLDKMLRASGSCLEECFRTNVVKVHPPNNKLFMLPKLGFKLDQWEDELWQEIDTVKPNAILALGNLALKALTGETGITNYRGSILQTKGRGIKVIPTIHPAALYHGEGESVYKYSARVYIEADIRRAVEESLSPKFELPERLLQIARNSLDAFRFFRQYEGKKKVAVDIEVANAIPTCVSFAFSPSHAISIPFLNLDDRLEQIPDHELFEMWDIIDNFLSREDIEVIGQNFKFDEGKLAAPFHIFVKNLYCDTSLLAHTLHPELPKSLAFLASVYTKEPYYKGEYKEYNPKKDTMDRVYLYNAKDAAVDFEVFEAMDKVLDEEGLRSFFYNYVMKLHGVYQRIENRGLRYNEQVRANLDKKYAELSKKLNDELEQLIGKRINACSPIQVARLIYEDLKFPRRQGTGEEVLTALYANHAKTPLKKRVLELIPLIRQAEKTRGTYVNFLPDEDDRVRTSYSIVGTETGRRSTQLLKSPVRPTVFIKRKGKPKVRKAIGLSFQTLTKHGDIGSDIRRMFIPDEGMVFVNVDLSQAEPRTVAHLSNDAYLKSCFERKIDIHRITASWFFCDPDISEEEALKQIPKRGPDGNEDPRRFIGKSGRNGGDYDMHKRRLMQTINTDARKYGIDVSVSEWRAGQILDIFHRKSPNIRGVFHREVVEFLANNEKKLTNPFGRVRQFMGRWDADTWREAYAYLPQSTIADKIGTALIELCKTDLDILLEAHDAFLYQCRPDEVQDRSKEVKKELEKGIDFSGCSLSRGVLYIPAEFEIGENYKDMDKLEVVL